METKTILRGAYHRIREFPRETVIRARKRWENRKPQPEFNPDPKVTAIIQCHNKANVVGKIVRRLQAAGIEEIIGIDDGSIDGTLRALGRVLSRPNDFVLRCNDIWEVRTYNQAMKMARGELIVLLQDDDLPPKNNQWIREAVHVFSSDPSLGVLGGRGGFRCIPTTSTDGVRIDYHPVSQELPPGKIRPCDTVNRAPMWVRATAAQTLNYLDEEFAPTFYDDADFCLRARKRGWQVAVYNPQFGRASRSGILAYNDYALSKYAGRNQRKVRDRHLSTIQEWNQDAA